MTRSKRSKNLPLKQVVPALNGCLIVGVFLYFYTADTQWIFWFVALFFLLAGGIKDHLIDFFMEGITLRAHIFVFALFLSAYAFVLLPIESYYQKAKALYE